jgi:hypothetical protein
VFSLVLVVHYGPLSLYTIECENAYKWQISMKMSAVFKHDEELKKSVMRCFPAEYKSDAVVLPSHVCFSYYA